MWGHESVVGVFADATCDTGNGYGRCRTLSAFQLSGPAIPSTLIPAACWKFMVACLVNGPNTLSGISLGAEGSLRESQRSARSATSQRRVTIRLLAGLGIRLRSR